jgi:hypothetical protein
MIYPISYAESIEALTYLDLRFGANSKLLHSATIYICNKLISRPGIKKSARTCFSPNCTKDLMSLLLC